MFILVSSPSWLPDQYGPRVQMLQVSELGQTGQDIKKNMRLQGKDTGGHGSPSQVVCQAGWTPSLQGIAMGPQGESGHSKHTPAKIAFNLKTQQFESNNTAMMIILII